MTDTTSRIADPYTEGAYFYLDNYEQEGVTGGEQWTHHPSEVSFEVPPPGARQGMSREDIIRTVAAGLSNGTVAPKPGHHGVLVEPDPHPMCRYIFLWQMAAEISAGMRKFVPLLVPHASEIGAQFRLDGNTLHFRHPNGVHVVVPPGNVPGGQFVTNVVLRLIDEAQACGLAPGSYSVVQAEANDGRPEFALSPISDGIDID